MIQRGRKSAAQLAIMPAVRRASAYNRKPPARDPLPPPGHLQPETKAWWAAIVADFELETYELHVLQAAAEAWDLYQHARIELAKHGLTYTDGKGMVRARPEAAIARDARTSFLRAVRELKLDVEPPKPPTYGGGGEAFGLSWLDR